MPRAATTNVGEQALRVLGDAILHAAAQMEDLLPPEARIHLIRAQRELLLAAIAALEHHQAPPPAGRGGRRVRRISLD
jgi:hypothetical protein